jgi:hypothetical protein
MAALAKLADIPLHMQSKRGTSSRASTPRSSISLGYNSSCGLYANAKGLCQRAQTDPATCMRSLGSRSGARINRRAANGPAAPGSPFLRARHASKHPLSDDGALEFRKDPHHLKHRLAGWSRRVEALLMRIEFDAAGMDFTEESDESFLRYFSRLCSNKFSKFELNLG